MQKQTTPSRSAPGFTPGRVYTWTHVHKQMWRTEDDNGTERFTPFPHTFSTLLGGDGRFIDLDLPFNCPVGEVHHESGQVYLDDYAHLSILDDDNRYRLLAILAVAS